MRRLGRYALLAALLPALVVAGAAAARKPAPRIVAAALQDADGDALADGVRLTYSQPVRHPADRDGRYPFSVPGYRIASVGAARGRTLLIALVERSSPDPAARPAVRYRPTRTQPVTSGSGVQAAAQIFRGTRAHGHA